jgi:S1-C subfamily serine protease
VAVDQDLRDAEVVAAAPCDDLALLKVGEGDGMQALELGTQDGLEQGEQVVAVGFPASADVDEPRVTSTAGVVSQASSRLTLPIPDSPRFENLIQTDAALNPGNSGGPLLDRDAKVVGVNTAILTESSGQPIQGQGYAIGADRVKDVLEDLRAGRSQGWVGAGFAFLPERELKRRGLPAGIIATGAVPGTSAAEARLQDVIITEVDGEPMDGTLASYCDAVDDLDSGERTSFTVIAARGRREQTVELQLE